MVRASEKSRNRRKNIWKYVKKNKWCGKTIEFQKSYRDISKYKNGDD